MGRTTGASSRASQAPARSLPARTLKARPSAAPTPAVRRRPSYPPRHHLSLPGAATVPVPVLEHLVRGLEQTVNERAIMCLYGDAGCGKTFALDTVLASGAVPARRARLIRLLPRPAPTPAALRAHLADALNLTDVRTEDPGVFDTALRKALAGRDHLLVVDEAQRLDAACFEYLRYLFDDAGTCLAIVLAAGERGLAVLRRQKMLASRTAVWLTIPALTPEEVRWVIPRFHPLWETSDPDAVDLLDTRLCHGNFRRWAQATHHTLRLLRASGGIADYPVLEDLLGARLLPHQDTR
ncbi:ATP-binding protein [Streptomyces sp. 21So2-11]|uniref:ATP-binding protein n=1 Tax=Streptomyces sp. 21So2-11 TaxID=3144408 RepID=UPI00321A61B4